MTGDAKKLLLVVASAAVVAALLIVFFPAILGSAAGPDVEIITTLKDAEAHGLKLDVGDAGVLSSTRVSFDRLSVVATGSHATVTATLDFDGAPLGTDTRSAPSGSSAWCSSTAAQSGCPWRASLPTWSGSYALSKIAAAPSSRAT